MKFFKNKNFLKTPKTQFGIFLLLILFIIGIFIFYTLFLKKFYRQSVDKDKKNYLENIQSEEFNPKFPRHLDGVFITEEDKTNLRPIAIMIDNMFDARPPIGLNKANLVIESITEANITRLLLFFVSGENIEKIGPVRSARPYFLEWAEEFRALYIHSGGSPEALNKIRNREYNVYDLNEFYFGEYFWRDQSREKPHNLFTSSEKFQAALEMKNITEEVNYQTWLFKDDSPVNQDEIESENVKIVYQDPEYLIEWKYDPLKNDYLRYQSGEKHLNANGSEIRAKNIVVQYVKMWILDEVGRKKIQTIGDGRAVIFQDGKVMEGKWSKSIKGERTMFFDEQNSEIIFNRGTSWIEVVPKWKEVMWN